jgi:phosphoglycolate phosphatase/AHBA synthesis associated protein
MAAHSTPPSHPDTAVDAVVFDFDGTLVASRLADEAAVAALIRGDPSAAAGAAVFWSLDGQPLIGRIERAWPGRTAAILPLFDGQGAPLVFPGIATLIERLSRRRLAMAVVSSRRRSALERGLVETGLRSHFRVVVGVEDVAQPKPSPEGLLLALRRLDVPPSRAVFIGDNELDLEAGRRAGVTTWRAVWGLPPSHPVLAHPDGAVLLRRPEEVADLLRPARSRSGPHGGV